MAFGGYPFILISMGNIPNFSLEGNEFVSNSEKKCIKLMQ